MKPIYYVLNLLVCLIVTLVYQNHSFDRFHILFVVISFIIAGTFFSSPFFLSMFKRYSIYIFFN